MTDHPSPSPPSPGGGGGGAQPLVQHKPGRQQRWRWRRGPRRVGRLGAQVRGGGRQCTWREVAGRGPRASKWGSSLRTAPMIVPPREPSTKAVSGEATSGNRVGHGARRRLDQLSHGRRRGFRTSIAPPTTGMPVEWTISSIASTGSFPNWRHWARNAHTILADLVAGSYGFIIWNFM